MNKRNFNTKRKDIERKGIYYPDTNGVLVGEDKDKEDKDNATRGYIEGTALSVPLKRGIKDNTVAWDMPSYEFIEGEAPDTVNPVLWRMEKLNNYNGLFQVLPKVEDKSNSLRDGLIYQIRTYDLANMIFVKSKTGWIIIDTLGGKETAAEGLRIFKKYIDSNARIRAIIITHSHRDHYNGITGLISPDELLEGVEQSEFEEINRAIPEDKTLVIAPNGFYDESISENLYLGNCMARRSIYMYGTALPRDNKGHIGSGLGKTVSNTTGTLLKPSFELRPSSNKNNELVTLFIDGLTIDFQDVPNTEAPAEFHIYLKDYQTLCPGENVTHTMHNLLTSRGAKVRDPKAFSKAIDKAIHLFSDVEVIVGTHHWPTWGNLKCIALMRKERDMYAFFNDQVIRMINKGMNMEEIADEFRLPKSLDGEFYNRGYYGSINHNVKAVFQHYVGWWDGNPANYFKYTDTEIAKRFVSDMGGHQAVLNKALQYYQNGDYRWTIELTRHLVFDNPQFDDARYLQADAFEQLAYSFECATWRNIFLSAAFELRRELKEDLPDTPEKFILKTVSMIQNLTPPYIFEYFATLVKGYEAQDANICINVLFQDSGENYNLHLYNGVLHQREGSSKNGPIVCFKNVTDFAKNFKTDMLHLQFNSGDTKTTSPMGVLYKYFDTHNGQWNIIEPLSD